MLLCSDARLSLLLIPFFLPLFLCDFSGFPLRLRFSGILLQLEDSAKIGVPPMVDRQISPWGVTPMLAVELERRPRARGTRKPSAPCAAPSALVREACGEGGRQEACEVPLAGPPHP